MSKTNDDEPQPMTEVARQRAIRFIERSGGLLTEDHLSIGPGDGSADVYYKGDAAALLVNFPPVATDAATYYGDDGGGGHVVKGELRTDQDADRLIEWLRVRTTEAANG